VFEQAGDVMPKETDEFRSRRHPIDADGLAAPSSS
jgi:hypothetical protein